MSGPTPRSGRDSSGQSGQIAPSSRSDPIVVAPTPLPLHADDAVDHDLLGHNVEKWSRTPLSGFVIGSAGGEELYVSEADRLEATRTVSDARRDGMLVIGGIDSPSTTEAIRLANAYAEAGADMVRVRIPQTPSGNTRGAAVPYFQTVTRHSPVPVIIIHQTWQTGGKAATPEEIGAICSLDNVFAYIFWHDIRFESYAKTLIPDTVRFWAPNGSLLLPGALIGANGACAFLANWAPHLVAEIMTLGLQGRFEEAAPIQRSVLRADFLGMTYGVRALKAGLNLLGYEATVPRHPVPPLDPPEVELLAEAFREAGLLRR